MEAVTNSWFEKLFCDDFSVNLYHPRLESTCRVRAQSPEATESSVDQEGHLGFTQVTVPVVDGGCIIAGTLKKSALECLAALGPPTS